MESSSLEIKVMFGKDLKAFNFFQKLTLYVLVSMVSDDPGKKLEQKQKHRTPTDKEGDGNPEWNHEMQFDLKEIPFQDCGHIFVQFELKHEGVMFGDKTIGEVRVPIKDLISEFNGVVRFVHYEVRNPDGKPNGVLSFSYKVNGMNSAIGTDFYPGTTQIPGFSIANDHSPQPAYEIQYPQAEYSPYSSPPGGSLYPRLEIEAAVMQPTYSTQQDVQYASPGTPHVPQESYYAPPNNYYPPPPQPPPPAQPFYPRQPHPPSPMALWAYYPAPANPSGFSNPWPDSGPQTGYHSYSMPGTWGQSEGHVHSFGHGETSPNGYLYDDYCRSSSWSGR